MQTETIIYQHSPQFLPKIAIKLENMLASVYEGTQKTHPIIHHYALKNIIEIIKIIDKPEIKSRLTKEFLRLEHVLPEHFKEKNQKLFQQFQLKCQEIQSLNSRFGSHLHLDSFLLSLRIRSQDQWSECELQLPFLYHWLHQSPEFRQEMLKNWLSDLKNLKAIIQIYLSILNHLTDYENITVTQNFFQKSFIGNPPCQLIQLKLKANTPIIPKIQTSTHAISIYFNDINNLEQNNLSSSFPIELGIVRI